MFVKAGVEVVGRDVVGVRDGVVGGVNDDVGARARCAGARTGADERANDGAGAAIVVAGFASSPFSDRIGT